LSNKNHRLLKSLYSAVINGAQQNG